jgi:hypothetical protein
MDRTVSRVALYNSSIVHIDQKKANSSPLGRIVTIIFQSSVWLFTLFGGLAGLHELLSHLDWGKALLQRLGFSL